MENTIIQAVKNYFHVQPKKIEALGGGFYGRAFFVTLPCDPSTIIAKLYLFPDFAAKEAEQIQLLSKHSLLKMPKIYDVQKQNASGLAYDIVFMEYLKGVNAGDFDVTKISENIRETICDEIVDNLIAIHNTVNPEGFGPLNTLKYYPSWQDYYYPIACKIVEKANELYHKKQLSSHVLSIFEQSIKCFHQIFYLPITKARLIHGDYNTWNILLAEDKTHAVAVIDPFDCCWADNEYDLYQLDNANGKGYGLLKKYSQKYPLSPNFQQKRCFYELYTEVNHYYNSHVEVNQEAVEQLAIKLKDFLMN